MTLQEFYELGGKGRDQLCKAKAKKIEFRMSGYKRQHRLCIDCIFQRGQADKRNVSSYGTAKVPVFKMRVGFGYPLHIDRWFPGALDALNQGRPGVMYFCPIWPYAFDHPYIGRGKWPGNTLIYMARCPYCQCWYELREFRGFPADFYITDIKFYLWDADKSEETCVDQLVCNKCFA